MAYIGKIPAAAALTADDISDGIISNAKLAQDIISGDTALGATPADTDEFLVSDAGTLKRVDYSYIKGGGKVNQVVQTVDTTIRSATTTSMQTTNISVTITPSASTSKIMLDFNGYVGFSTGLRAFFQVYKDVGGAGASAISIPGSLDGMMVVGENDTATSSCVAVQMRYLDSPSTTSQIVYTMYWNPNGGGAHTMYLGEMKGGANNTCPTFFTATEILA